MKYTNIIAISLFTGAWSAPTPPRSLDLAVRSGGTLSDDHAKRLYTEGRQSSRPSLGGFNGWTTPPTTSGGRRRDVNADYKEARQLLGGLLGSDDETAGATKREAKGNVVPAHNDKRQLLGGLSGGLEDDPVTGAAKREPNGDAVPSDKGKRQRQPPPPPPSPPPQPAPSDSTRRHVKFYKEGRQLSGVPEGSDDFLPLGPAPPPPSD